MEVVGVVGDCRLAARAGQVVPDALLGLRRLVAAVGVRRIGREVGARAVLVSGRIKGSEVFVIARGWSSTIGREGGGSIAGPISSPSAPAKTTPQRVHRGHRGAGVGPRSTPHIGRILDAAVRRPTRKTRNQRSTPCSLYPLLCSLSLPVQPIEQTRTSTIPCRLFPCLTPKKPLQVLISSLEIQTCSSIITRVYMRICPCVCLLANPRTVPSTIHGSFWTTFSNLP